MSISRLMQKAAAGAGGEGPAVEDVFSTYVYEGSSGTTIQGIGNGINLGDLGVGTSTSFNESTDDFLIRTSDFTGNSDSNSFTFSCWIYKDNLENGRLLASRSNNNGINVYSDSGGADYITIYAWDTSSNRILNLFIDEQPLSQMYHLLVSIDLSNSSNRHVYINDVDVSSSLTWNTYTNGTIDFTQSAGWIINGQDFDDISNGTQNIAHMFLDYTYRDLTVESNRRIFIDSNGGSTDPSTLESLNPILYLPLTEDYSIGENIGTGGDFSINGVPQIDNIGTRYEQDSGSGGLVWTKRRDGSNDHILVDTERGPNENLRSNLTNSVITFDTISSFNSYGYIIDSADNTMNSDGNEYVSWTFRKAPKFFDVVTYTGNGTYGRTISHNLGVKPGVVILKNIDGNSSWPVYHQSVWPNTGYLQTTNDWGTATTSGWFANTEPTSSVFSVGDVADSNTSGSNYVAYLFANNDGDGEFGPDGDQDIIKCGSYTGNTGTLQEINLGFEPQWIMIKNTTSSSNWMIIDAMRGIVTGGDENTLAADSSGSENGVIGSPDTVDLIARGFQVKGSTTAVNVTGDEHIYIAIRRGPMRPPESGTEVVAPKVVVGDRTGNHVISGLGFAPDFVFGNGRGGGDVVTYDKLRGATRSINTSDNSAETDDVSLAAFLNDGYLIGSNGGRFYDDGNGSITWSFRRAPEFFDVVAYTGGNLVSGVVKHNLGVKPEMVIIKQRNTVLSIDREWAVGAPDILGINNNTLSLNNDYANGTLNYNMFNTVDGQTSTQIKLHGNENGISSSAGNYIAYLFATLPGVSKVGSYTGNGSSQTIDCGFTSGARFILIKRTDSTGDWYVWDTARGIVAGDDPFLELNTTDPEVTTDDSIDPDSSGFIVNQTATANINVSSGEYIFLAIA